MPQQDREWMVVENYPCYLSQVYDCVCVIWLDMTTPPWWRAKVMVYYYYLLKYSAKLLLLKDFGSARLGESDIHTISPKTPTAQYQSIDKKIRSIKNHWPCSWNPPVPHHRTRGQQDHSRGTLRGEQKSCGTARFCNEVALKYTDVRPGHRVLPALAHTAEVAHH